MGDNINYKERLIELQIAARSLATEADMYAEGETNRDDLEIAINEVEILTMGDMFVGNKEGKR